MNLFEHNDNFEQFLREATENFRMRPSIRVWNSVYNNIHPSKKTPSAAAFLVFIISFFILNSNNSIVFQQGKSTETKTAANVHKNPLLTYSNKSNKIENIAVYKKQHIYHPAIKITTQEQFNRKANADELVIASIENGKYIDFSGINSMPDLQDSNLQQQINNLVAGAKHNDNLKTQQPFYVSERNKDESELSYQLYATSSVGYSNGYRNTETEISTSSTDHLQNVTDLNKTLRYMPEFNLEAGGAFLVNVTSSLRLKAGMQLNYTNYKLANENEVGDVATNEINNSIINNGALINDIQMLHPDMNTELKKYNSSTYEISIPLGTELELIGNHQLKWFAGATIQPSYLVGGYPGENTNEMKSYLQDGYGFRKWNVNTSFETFLSYKLPNGSRINAGPQFRYQLFSSYESKYLYNDKQYNIGLKIGISRNF